MKRYINLILAVVTLALLVITCNNPETTKEPDAYYNEVIIHDTLVVYIDSLVYTPASYYEGSYKDSVFLKEGIWTQYPNIGLLENRRLVVDSANNVSIKYKGGWVDRTDPENSGNLCDCFNDHEAVSDFIPGQVIVYDDTVYLKRTVPVSYAIFEITKGSEIITDTAVYGRCVEIKEIHNYLQKFDDYTTYFEKFDDYYYNYTFTVDYNNLVFSENRHKKFFTNFHKLPLQFVNTKGSYDMYLVDIFPYWDVESTQNTMVLYVYIPDVFL